MNGPLDGIYRLKSGVRTRRISSYDRQGSNKDFVPVAPGATAVMADIPGAGIIKHIWITLDCPDPMIRRNAVMRMYWDGETAPSVEAPLGDFFGQGWGEAYNYASLPLAASPSEGKALNCYFPMPFGNGARLTLDNESDQEIRALFYYIDYEEHEEVSAELGRFHASWRRELTESHPDEGETEWQVVAPEGNNPSVSNNYAFADIEGRGHFVGIHYFVENPGPMWYGEGDDMWLVDGEPWPGSLHGTGTEDFFNGAWCPNEVYAHPYFGYARVPNKYAWAGRTHCYRFMLEDPVYFERSLHASIEHGHNNNLTLDLCTVAYWYQSEPHKPYPELPDRAGRQNMPEIWAADIHYWRHHWRQAMGGGKKLWGNERQ
ncbi:glycoside hydrolase family 172 protein [Cohnella sp. GCM10027633]|uniref:glycoside hydrolase family 172 protein n=1 Tax=unclassified Cohnella TaxID=2636738 RepID=UPI003643693A